MDKYEIFYTPNSDNYIIFYFYEHGARQFSNSGIAIYHNLEKLLMASGTAPLSSVLTNNLKKPEPRTPEAFNEQHKGPTFLEALKRAGFIIFATFMYLLIVLIPGWVFLGRFVTTRPAKVAHKRIIVGIASTVLLFPIPFPLTMFGPFLLVPGGLVLFGGSEYLNELGHFFYISVAGTAVFSILGVFRFVGRTPNHAMERTR